jgi:hypothetical protein
MSGASTARQPGMAGTSGVRPFKPLVIAAIVWWSPGRPSWEWAVLFGYLAA